MRTRTTYFEQTSLKTIRGIMEREAAKAIAAEQIAANAEEVRPSTPIGTRRRKRGLVRQRSAAAEM